MNRERPPKRASRIYDTLQEAGLLDQLISRHETIRIPVPSDTTADEELELDASAIVITREVLHDELDPPTALSDTPQPEDFSGKSGAIVIDEETLDQSDIKALLAEREGALDEGPTALSRPWQPGDISLANPGVVGGRDLKPAQLPPDPLLSSMSLRTLPTIPLLTPESVMEKASDADLILRHPIGEGGTSQVYLAVQRSLGRQVAVKYARAGTSQPNAVSMLLQEGALMGHLEHPNIIPVHVLGTDEKDQPVLVMKYVEGVSWSALLKDDQHPFWDKLKVWSKEPLIRHLEILLEIAKAVEYAHARGVIHLDIKPDNVMLGEFGEVYLFDWGIARRSPKARRAEIKQTLPPIVPEVDGVCGTPMYMAPEMFSDAQYLDERTDVYLLGATLHEILIGRPPHSGQTLLEAFVSAFQAVDVLARATERHHVPRELLHICQKALQVDPSSRHQHVSEVRNEIIDFLRHRASFHCCDAADASLVELQQLWSREPEPGFISAHRQQMLQIFAECRFGYRQALRIWDGNATARNGLMDAVKLMFAMEYERRDIEAAAVLLEELDVVPEVMREQLNALRQLVDEERREQERLRQLQRDLDASVAQRQRVQILLAMGGYAGVLGMLRFIWGPVAGYQRALVFAGSSLALLLGFLFAGRKKLLQNEVNRRFASLMVLCSTSILVHRIVRASLGHPIELTYGFDLLILTWVSMTSAFVWRLWLGSLAGVFLVGAVLAFWAPAAAIYVMTICVTSGWLLCAYFWVWEQKQRLLEQA